MKIAVLGPCDLSYFTERIKTGFLVPDTYSFPYISQLALTYLKKGHEVEIVTSSENVKSTVRVPTHEGLGITIVPRRARARERAFDLFSEEIKWISEATMTANPDVIHAHWLYEFAAGALTVQSDALVTAHDAPLSVVRHYGQHAYWWFREVAGVRTLRQVTNITAVAPTLARELAPFLATKQKVHVIPNGLELDDSCLPPHRNLAKLRQAPVFATVANGFDKRKNTATAIRAFAFLRQSYPAAQLVMYGNGHEPDGIAQQWARRRGLDVNIDFRGPVGHVELLQDMRENVDVIVHPSRWEACSLAILEARSLGIPTIGSRKAGGVSYTLDDGLSGCLVDQKPRHYATAMKALVENPNFYRHISSNSCEQLMPLFDLNVVSDTYLGLLSKILEVRA